MGCISDSLAIILLIVRKLPETLRLQLATVFYRPPPGQEIAFEKSVHGDRDSCLPESQCYWLPGLNQSPQDLPICLSSPWRVTVDHRSVVMTSDKVDSKRSHTAATHPNLYYSCGMGDSTSNYTEVVHLRPNLLTFLKFCRCMQAM